MKDSEKLIVNALAKLDDAKAMIKRDKIREAGVAAGMAGQMLELAARILDDEPERITVEIAEKD